MINPNAPLNRPDAPAVDDNSPLLKPLKEVGPLLLELECWAEAAKSKANKPYVKWILQNPHEDGLMLEGRYVGGTGSELTVFDWNNKIEDILHVRGVYQIKLTKNDKGYFEFSGQPQYIGKHSIDAHQERLDILEPKIPEDPNKKPGGFRFVRRDSKKHFIAEADIKIVLPRPISNIVRDTLYDELKVRFGKAPQITFSEDELKIEMGENTNTDIRCAIVDHIGRILRDAKPEYIGRAQPVIQSFMESKIHSRHETLLKSVTSVSFKVTAADSLLKSADQELSTRQDTPEQDSAVQKSRNVGAHDLEP